MSPIVQPSPEVGPNNTQNRVGDFKAPCLTPFLTEKYLLFLNIHLLLLLKINSFNSRNNILPSTYIISHYVESAYIAFIT